PGAEYLQAVCQLHLGRARDAQTGLTRCLDRRPGFAWTRLLRGLAEMELDDFAAARADFDAVLANPPEPLAGSVALVNRGVPAMRQKDWDGAVADFRLAIRQESPALPAYVNLALTHRQRVGWPAWQPALMALGPQGAFALAAVEAHRRRALGEAVAALD